MVAMVTLAVLVMSACNAPEAEYEDVFLNASYPTYTSVPELTDQANLIVEGTIVSTATREIDVSSPLTDQEAADPELNPGGTEQGEQSLMVYTVHQVRVERVIKGSASEGDTIEVKELGGTVGKARYATDYGVVLDDGGSYVLFLQTFETAPASLLNPIQSVYEEVGGKLTALPANTLDVEAVAALQRSED
jgi:hypothetical protein